MKNLAPILALDPLARAVTFAAEIHAGQVDKAGKPYILHPLRVMLQLRDKPDQIAALLHDTVEDGDTNLGAIALGFGFTIRDAVDALTRRPDETYPDFIQRCGRNPIARRVKLADIADNMNLARLGREPTEADLARQRKYADAKNVLLDLAPL